MSPLLYMHIWVGLLLATIFRVNRLWALFASTVPSLFGLLRPLILVGEIATGHLIIEHEWVHVDRENILEQARGRIVDLLVGAGVWGLVFGALFGLVAYVIARRRKPAELPAPTSESPPSGSPAPPS
jgi:hypothetical protein